MIRSILSVGAFTLLSRVTGFARDIVLGALLGAGAANDAFVIAFRLPNHFRAIFGEGAFNAAYVPAYAGTLERRGRKRRASIRIADLHASSHLADHRCWRWPGPSRRNSSNCSRRAFATSRRNSISPSR